jgi:hypothetical protein
LFSIAALFAARCPAQTGPGYALWFHSALSQFVEVPFVNVPSGDSSYTIEAWINPNAMAVNGIIGWGNYEANNQVNAFGLTDTGLINYWWGNDLRACFKNAHFTL